MSIWSKIAKIGGFALAPFTGGVSIPIGQAVGGGIDAFSRGAGSASQAQASNRGTKAELMLDQNTALERELIAREQEKREARDNAYKNAQRAAMAYNWQPTQAPSNIPVVRFGGGGVIGSPQAKAAGDELLKQSMNRLTQPDLQVDGGGSMPAYKNLWEDPEFRKTLKPGIMERIMGYGSAFSPLVGALLNRGSSGGDPNLPGGSRGPF